MHKVSPIASAFAALLIVLLSSAAGPCRVSAAEPGAAQAKPLVGTWEGVEIGREAAGKSRITFEGDSVHFKGADGAEWYKGTVTTAAPDAGADAAAAGADQNPNQQLVAKISECPFPQFIGKSALFIYKVENGKLTMVGHRPGDPTAPKSFDGDATSRTFVFTKVAAP